MQPDNELCSYEDTHFVIRYYYDGKENKCFPFNYDSECGENHHHFLTKQDCESRCKSSYAESGFISALSSS